MNYSELNQAQCNIIYMAAVRCLVAEGILSKESLMADVSRQGVPAEWAFLIKTAIEEMPDR